MNRRFFFMATLLERLSRPAFFCRAVAMTLRVAAALIALLSLTIVFKIGKLTFDLTPNTVLGGVLFAAFFILAVYAAVHVVLIRARDIETSQLGDTYAISVLAIMIKMLGEAYCAFVVFMSLGGGLFVWFTTQSVANILGPLVRALFPVVGDDPSFMGGIEFIGGGALFGLIALILAYATSQALATLVRPVRVGQHLSSVEAGQAYRSRFGL